MTSTKVNGSLEMIPKNPVPGLELKIGVLIPLMIQLNPDEVRAPLKSAPRPKIGVEKM